MNQIFFFVGLAVLGWIFLLPLRRFLPASFMSLSGVLWGMWLYVLGVLLSLFIFGRCTGGTLGMLLVLFGLVLGGILRYTRQDVIGVRPWRTDLGWLLGSQLALAFVALAVQRFNFSMATVDSFGQIWLGRSLAYPDSAWQEIGRLGTHGALVPILQSASVFLGVEYLTALSPALAFGLAGGFTSLCIYALRQHTGFSIAMKYGVLLAALMFSTNFIIFQSVYLHTAFAGAAYLGVAVGAFWLGIRLRQNAWLGLGVAALLAYSVTRIEAPLFALIFLALLLCAGGLSYSQRLGVALPYLLSMTIWFGLLSTITGGAKFLTPERALAMSGGFLVCALGVLLTRWRRLEGWMSFVPRWMSLVLLCVLLVMIVLRPTHMIESSSAVLINLFGEGRWGATWWVLLILALVGWRRPRFTGEALFSAGIPSFALLVVALAFLRTPYHLHWWDSANRMFTHLLPVMILYMALKYTSEIGGGKQDAS